LAEVGCKISDYGNVESMLSGLDDKTQRILRRIFEYVLKDLRFGRGEDGYPAKNFGAGFYAATTPAVANTAFTVTHSFGRIPYLVVPVLPLDKPGAKIVRLTVTQAADASRLYLSSPDTSAPIYLYVEG